MAAKKKLINADHRPLGGWCSPIVPTFAANFSFLCPPVQKISMFEIFQHKVAPPGDRFVKWNSPRSKVVDPCLVRILKIWCENSYGKCPKNHDFRAPQCFRCAHANPGSRPKALPWHTESGMGMELLHIRGSGNWIFMPFSGRPRRLDQNLTIWACFALYLLK